MQKWRVGLGQLNYKFLVVLFIEQIIIECLLYAGSSARAEDGAVNENAFPALHLEFQI